MASVNPVPCAGKLPVGFSMDVLRVTRAQWKGQKVVVTLFTYIEIREEVVPCIRVGHETVNITVSIFLLLFISFFPDPFLKKR